MLLSLRHDFICRFVLKADNKFESNPTFKLQRIKKKKNYFINPLGGDSICSLHCTVYTHTHTHTHTQARNTDMHTQDPQTWERCQSDGAATQRRPAAAQGFGALLSDLGSAQEVNRHLSSYQSTLHTVVRAGLQASFMERMYGTFSFEIVLVRFQLLADTYQWGTMLRFMDPTS